MRLSRRALATTALASLAGLLTACGGTADTRDAPAADAAVGGTLRIALAEDPGIQDPHAFTGHFLILDMIFEPLLAYGPDGVLEPRLATDWSVSDDGLAVVFDLRDDVAFHDGEPFDAEAVVWNFERWVADENFGFFRTSRIIDHVEATDEHTVTLTLSEPYEPLLQELTFGRPVRFLSPAAAGPDGEFVEPIGTGAWRYESSSATEAELSRNDDYWGELPALDDVHFTVRPDSQGRVAALRTGEVDLIGGTYLAPITPVEIAGLEGQDGITLYSGEPDTTFLLGFNAAGPAGEHEVRAAITQAIDRDALAEVLFAGTGELADTLFPAGIPDSGAPMDLTHDPAAARALLDDAGWEEDAGGRSRDRERLELQLLVPSSPVHGMPDTRAPAEAVAGDLADVGIEVSITPVDAAAYNDERGQGHYDLAFLVTLGAPYDPSATIESYLTGRGDTLWTSPELDALVDEALLSLDPEHRASVYEQIYDLLEAESAYVPLVFQPRYWATGPAVSGFTAPVTEYELDLTGVTVQR